jgi:hypothetical protein
VPYLIPGRRLSVDYLARLLYESHKCWIQVLHRYGVTFWKPASPWSVPLRKLRAYLRFHAWKGPAEHIRWRIACGCFDGRAAIGNTLRPLLNEPLANLVTGETTTVLARAKMRSIQGSERWKIAQTSLLREPNFRVHPIESVQII